MASIQSTKTLLLYVSVSVLCGGIISFLAFHKNGESSEKAKDVTVEQAGAVAQSDKGEPGNYELVTEKNRKGLELISPLLYSKAVNEAKGLGTLKSGVANIIEEGKRADLLTQASVYLVSLTDGSWMSINPDEEYHPGSLIKVPMLMTYLKQAATTPALLDIKIRYDKEMIIPTQTYTSQKLKLGEVYTVKDLLRYMISYSDNNATQVLNQNANVQLFKETFTDLNLPEPDVKDRNFTMNARRYSEFLMVLYNATYLSQKASQYSLELLSESAFKDGMVKITA
jgi:beta-lactamase class A